MTLKPIPLPKRVVKRKKYVVIPPEKTHVQKLEDMMIPRHKRNPTWTIRRTRTRKLIRIQRIDLVPEDRCIYIDLE
jgi:hypothetical protein